MNYPTLPRYVSASSAQICQPTSQPAAGRAIMQLIRQIPHLVATMSDNNFDHRKFPTIKPFDDTNKPMELRCQSCGSLGMYHVGVIMFNPDIVQARSPDEFDSAFGCSGYFRCICCNSGGPWLLTDTSIARLIQLLNAARPTGETPGLYIGEMRLFDGTIVRFATEAEEHLKGLIAKRPDYHFLYNRLGNLYKSGGATQLAIEAYTEALKRNEHDIESMHSMGQICEAEGDDEKAAHWYHQVLLHARHCPEESVSILRAQVDANIRTLAAIHLRSDKKIPFFPTPQLPDLPPSEPLVVELRSLCLGDEHDREQLVDMWVGDRAPRSARQAPRTSGKKNTVVPPTMAHGPKGNRVGRNDPCPCGSGKKFKTCCMRK